MQVLDAIKKIIATKKEKSIMPECALLVETMDLLPSMTKEDLLNELRELYVEGIIEFRPTINDKSFYLN